MPTADTRPSADCRAGKDCLLCLLTFPDGTQFAGDYTTADMRDDELTALVGYALKHDSNGELFKACVEVDLAHDAVVVAAYERQGAAEAADRLIAAAAKAQKIACVTAAQSLGSKPPTVAGDTPAASVDQPSKEKPDFSERSSRGRRWTDEERNLLYEQVEWLTTSRRPRMTSEDAFEYLASKVWTEIGVSALRQQRAKAPSYKLKTVGRLDRRKCQP